MITITAVIRALPGRADALRDALCAVAQHVAQHEPDTVGFYISQDLADPLVFTTYERFASEAAKDAHNGSVAVAQFFAMAETLIDGPVILQTCTEISCKPLDAMHVLPALR
ncbi:MAG: quinol monooxygenase YgiN [Paracoccaceae bacterium]|jgi:quinol monooxygenase YgiN